MLYQLDGQEGGSMFGHQLTTEVTRVVLRGLLPYTKYRLRVAACNSVSHTHHLCADLDNLSVASETTFMTAVGTPGVPNPPHVSFINSSMATITWNSDFALGAPEPSYWSLAVVRVEQDNVTAMKENVMVRQVG